MSKLDRSKDEIIKYIIEYNNTNNKNLKQRDALKIFKRSTIETHFGTWTNALIEANVKTDRTTKLVNCKTCNIEFKKAQNEIEKSNNNFCSRSCSVTYNNKNRVITDDHKQNISNGLKRYAELSETIPRHIAGTHFVYNEIEYYSPGIQYPPLRVKIKTCVACNNEFKSSNRKTCSKECLKICEVKAGLASQASQQKRSKNEILFYELCVAYFKDTEVLSNPLMFEDKNGNFWDADVVIPKYNISIAWNGIWHYEQLNNFNHKLQQVQSRDKIKKKIVTTNGYAFYEIKDMGKYNKNFVYQKFHEFIFSYFIHFEMKMMNG